MIMKNGKQIGFIYKNGEKIDKIIRHGKVYFEQGFTREETATTLPIAFNGIGKNLKDYRIYGNSEQLEIPIPEDPAEIISCGNKTSNIFNKNNSIILTGYLTGTSSGGNFVLTGSGGTNRTICEKCKSNTTYTIQKKIIDNNRFRIGTVSQIPSASQSVTNFQNSDTENSITITTGENDNYLLLHFYNTNSTSSIEEALNTIKIEEGSIATDYEPFGYKIPININNIITNIYLEEPLRKISEYSDYIDFKNNKIMRNIKKLVLNGNESWTESSTNNTNIKRWRHNGQRSIILHPNSNNENAKLLSESFQIKTAAQTYTRNEGISVDTSGDILIYYPSIVSGPANFKEWLSNNNVLTIFALQTPIEENIELPKILTANENNTLTIETEVTPSQIYIKYKSNK